MDTKSRELVVLLGDDKKSTVRYSFGTMVESALLYVGRHDPEFFKGMLNKEYLDKVLKTYGIQRGSAGKSELTFDYRNAPIVEMDSRTKPDKKYWFPFPSGPVDEYGRQCFCSCDNGRHSKKDSDINITCIHSGYPIIFSGEKLGLHKWVGRRAKRILARTVRKIALYGKRLRGDEINDMFYREARDFQKALKDELLTKANGS